MMLLRLCSYFDLSGGFGFEDQYSQLLDTPSEIKLPYAECKKIYYLISQSKHIAPCYE